MKKYPFMEMTAEEMAKEMDKALRSDCKMTEEEIIEDDAEYGYFDDDSISVR